MLIGVREYREREEKEGKGRKGVKGKGKGESLREWLIGLRK